MGPFLISCIINERDVFWFVEEGSVFGTTTREKASLFYIVPTNDPTHPSEFYISYESDLADDQPQLVSFNDRSRMTKTMLPLYISADINVFGLIKGPLKVKPTLLVEQARFCLHSRVQSSFAFMCMSTPVSLSEWFQGELCYINCCRRLLKVDGYVSMRESSLAKYETTTTPSFREPKSLGDGMLFRLHPPPKIEAEPEATAVTQQEGNPKRPQTLSTAVPPTDQQDPDQEEGNAIPAQETQPDHSALVQLTHTVQPVDKGDIVKPKLKRQVSQTSKPEVPYVDTMSYPGQYLMMYANSKEDTRESRMYAELGLGRGVDITHINMWKNKTSFLVKMVPPNLTILW